MKLAYILLGLIYMHPDLSGYEMKYIIEHSTGFFFKVHLSQIYPTLKHLTEKQWVTFEVIKQKGKPDMKLYTITETGKVELDACLTEPYHFEYNWENLNMYFSKLLLMGHLDTEDIIAYIDSGIKVITQITEEIRTGSFADIFQTKESFLSNIPPVEQKQYLTIWENEHRFICEEFERRLTLLETIKKELKD